jgi:hypothetical protein
MLKSWAIHRYGGSGKLRYLGVISATGQEDAISSRIRRKLRAVRLAAFGLQAGV